MKMHVKNLELGRSYSYSDLERLDGFTIEETNLHPSGKDLIGHNILNVMPDDDDDDNNLIFVLNGGNANGYIYKLVYDGGILTNLNYL